MMCVLTIKRDANMDLIKAKSCIAVLGNLEECTWSKSNTCAPVPRPDLFCFLVSEAVNQRCKLKQGDVQNTFCNGDLPSDKVTILRSPIRDPRVDKQEFWLLQKTLFDLLHSPHH